jgi:penicillin-binding protein 2
VLAFVVRSFDPNLFVDGIDIESWQALNESLDKPLLELAPAWHLPARLHPQTSWRESRCKRANARAGTIISDNASHTFGGHTFAAIGTSHPGSVDMYKSIVKSNVYYYCQLTSWVSMP